MERAFLERYADVLLASVGLEPGQNLLVRAEPVHLEFAAILAERAYERGARYVRFDNNDIENPLLYKARVAHSRDEYLEYVPELRKQALATMLEEGWALIAVRTPEDPDFLVGLDQKRNARVARATAEAMKPYQRRISSNEIPWLVAFYPTEKLAARIMGMAPGAEAVEALWKVLIPILRLDRPDPAAFWVEHGKVLAERSERLNALALDTVRFRGPGTDLSVGLAERSVWRGGPDLTKAGKRFSPNIPTEEVFTSPDYRRTEGRVAFTRPILVPVVGKIVEGGWLRFEKGRVVEWGADSGKDVLDVYLDLDEGTRYLGELALVDTSSPIFEANRVFYNILFDENAACHIALGSAYSACVRDGDGLDEAALKELGANASAVHTDFMIGAPDVEVTGRTRDGREVPIISGGKFAI
ncbi:MAG: aminopeptidase [Spirochaetales bacterium]|nr:aminopeptidase [Spirochaetales bacterium]